MYLQHTSGDYQQAGHQPCFNFISRAARRGELLIVSPFFLSGALFTPEQLANGFVTSVILLVGLGTVIHSMLDYSISVLIWKPLCIAIPELRNHKN